MSCKKAQGFLEHTDIQVKDVTDAGKQKRGRAEALALARSAETILVARGKKVVRFDMKNPPHPDTLAEHLLGPTGNLRAPTLRIGKLLLVGFNEDAYREVLKNR